MASCPHTRSMYFLLQKDGLAIPYFALQLLFLCIGVLPFLAKRSYLHIDGVARAPGHCVDGTPHALFRALVLVCGALAALVECYPTK